MPVAFPNPAFPLEESRLKALWRNPGLFGDAGGDGAGASDFLISFAPEDTARGFEESCFGLLKAFAPFERSGSRPDDPAFEPEEENLELMLVIHEFRLPVAPVLESFEDFEFGVLGSSFADAECPRCGLCREL